MPAQPVHIIPSCRFDINNTGGFRERRRELSQDGHTGSVYEMLSPDGINFGYYNLRSSNAGEIVIRNTTPFFQMSYTVSGSKSYSAQGGADKLASLDRHQYNYLFFPEEDIHMQWPAHEQLEIFELGVSPELVLQAMPHDHPLFEIFSGSIARNEAAAISAVNLPLQSSISTILYDMLHCPLEGRYKQLFLKAKTIELLAIQLAQYEQMAGLRPRESTRTLRKEDVERMHMARDIIASNIHSPCTLIDLAHQVGTNDAYLKSHFKQVFGTTVYGYLQGIKMAHARELLGQGKQVSEVAYLSGYKHTAHFTRAFKKYFGYAPGRIKGGDF
ncbi:AraC family transcriptional regulator [Chitinophaga sp.]|mgnify:CR=1 FL=1|uniref:helix-turn-helix transcriptional regulator n=1 Tax=Chitinophaga sp. TaxID=1869181 RepID=UPI0026045B54|nr:AraC family transcriptional regulator [uncultured Chitinophaga sp.]